MKKILYSCIRCGYETNDKRNMRNHFNRTKDCPPGKNDIKLTDEIKDKILADRFYVIPKKIIIKPAIILNDEESHFIYMLRPKENVSHNENVYKIGKTKVKNLDINISRLTSYGKGTEIICLNQCKNCDILEKKILEEFNIKFDRHKFGNEYFIGDKYEMIETISNLIIEHNKNYIAVVRL
jgi:hypothetical protein